MTIPPALPGRACLVALATLLLLAPGDAARADVNLERVATGLTLPVSATSPPGDPRLFVVELGGTIRVLSGGAVLPQPFLDISARVQTGGERGLLGLAFPPDHAASGHFYVYYTREPDGATTVSRFPVDPTDPDLALDEEEVLFTVAQPASNHNAGHIAFGPDGMLYIALGDGGGPAGVSQDWTSALGKMLRIDVSIAPGYFVPLSNPGVQHLPIEPLGDPRIWALGLRNPFRWSFDRLTGDLYLADVGGALREEVNLQPAGSPGGENYGWPITEGSLCLTPPVGCDAAGLTPPVIEYAHAEPRAYSVVGGYRYRGPEPTLQGSYFFGDFYLPAFEAEIDGGGGISVSEIELVADVGDVGSLGAFAEDADGELYVLDLFDGEIFRFVDRRAICNDGIDNDGDGLVDWDGGGLGGPDPQCLGSKLGREGLRLCGIGFEVALVLPLLALARRLRARRAQLSSR